MRRTISDFVLDRPWLVSGCHLAGIALICLTAIAAHHGWLTAKGDRDREPQAIATYRVPLAPVVARYTISRHTSY
ncbi:MAG: hypothetical protein AAFX40_18620 [Cyanobacteria bacterium J06639_1]